MMMSLKIHVTLVTILVFFERSYVIPLSFQSFIVRAELAQDLSSQFMAKRAPQGYLMSKNAGWLGLD